jgi:hypothetical protein
MIRTIDDILSRAMDRLGEHLMAVLPPLVAAVIILGVTWVLAVTARWLLTRAFKGLSIDRFLAQTGVSTILAGAGRIRASRLAASGAYWLILLAGTLTAVNVFDTKMSTQIVERAVLLLPNLVTAGAILLAGAWLSQYLGRSALVWAVNEELPWPRRIGAAVRVASMFVAVVVAAHQLDFAANVFFAAFVIFAGGAVLTLGLALGLGARGSVSRYFEERRQKKERETEDTLWNHL